MTSEIISADLIHSRIVGLISGILPSVLVNFCTLEITFFNLFVVVHIPNASFDSSLGDATPRDKKTPTTFNP